MSYLSFPDPHPGRCPNLRMHYSASRGAEYLRCLRTASPPHHCRFPFPDPEPEPMSHSHNITAPEPWVEPL